MVRKASTRKRQTEVAGKKKLVAGEDFAPPEPIASVLPRIQLTHSQAEELWALVCKDRRCIPDNDDDAAMAKEIFEAGDLTSAVQQALQFYVRDVAYRVGFPKVRRELNAFRRDIDRFLARLPQEHESVGFFLRRTYTGEVYLAKRPTDEQLAQRNEAWSSKHGFDAIRNSLSESQRNIDCAASLLSGTRPPNVAVNSFVRSLAHAWKAATGCCPKSSRDPHNASRQSGPFAEFVRAVNGLLPSELPSEYRNAPLDHAIRSVCVRNEPQRAKAKGA
jgi:HEPN domain-containing protein